MEICIKYNDHSITNPVIEEISDYANIDKLETVYNKIYIGDLFNFIQADNILSTILKLKTKLKPSGLICVEEYDLFELSNAFIRGKIHSPDFNNIMRPRQQLLAIQDIYDISQRASLKIVSKDIDNYKHFVELQYV